MKISNPEQVKQYYKNYYEQHKDRMNQQHDSWRKANPKRIKIILDRWLVKNPHYSRDNKRKRTAITEPLIFEFLDYFEEGDLNDFISCLRSDGISEQYIRWFKVDIKKYVERA